VQLDINEKQLIDVLNRAIRDLEKVEDDPETMNFVARRIGNIVKHMKDLRDDLRPRRSNGVLRNRVNGEEP
jgi:hypothetical protein